MPFLDYTAIREMVSLEDVLKLLNYSLLIKTKWRSYGKCPLYCCAQSRACSFYLSKNLWFCHRCKRGGSQLDLYVYRSGSDLYHSTLEICNRLAIKPPMRDKPEPLTDKQLREEREKGK